MTFEAARLVNHDSNAFTVVDYLDHHVINHCTNNRLPINAG